MYLRETVPAGPNAEAEAKRIPAGFVHEVYERRHPRTDATVGQWPEWG
jgi:integrase